MSSETSGREGPNCELLRLWWFQNGQQEESHLTCLLTSPLSERKPTFIVFENTVWIVTLCLSLCENRCSWYLEAPGYFNVPLPHIQRRTDHNSCTKACWVYVKQCWRLLSCPRLCSVWAALAGQISEMEQVVPQACCQIWVPLGNRSYFRQRPVWSCGPNACLLLEHPAVCLQCAGWIRLFRWNFPFVCSNSVVSYMQVRNSFQKHPPVRATSLLGVLLLGLPTFTLTCKQVIHYISHDYFVMFWGFHTLWEKFLHSEDCFCNNTCCSSFCILESIHFKFRLHNSIYWALLYLLIPGALGGRSLYR